MKDANKKTNLPKMRTPMVAEVTKVTNKMSKQKMQLTLLDETTKTKRCTKCREVKELSEFTNKETGKQGKAPHCKKCMNAQHKEYYNAHIKENSVRGRRWDKQHPERRWAISSIHSHKKRRSCKIEMTLDELADIAERTKTCEYCGNELIYIDTKGNKNNWPSLDRINNKMPITKQNAEIICYRCNTAKSDRTQKEFVDHCIKVAQKFRLVEEDK
jgi:hypothetical protein